MNKRQINAIEKAVKYALDSIGLEEFKKTSFFARNWKNDELHRDSCH